jgi:signal transduction histidine kinase
VSVNPVPAPLMTDRRVTALLLLAIVVATLAPLVASFYFMDRALQTSLNLGFNPQIMQALEDESRNLRTLRDIDPEKRDVYRRQFEQVEELRQVYSGGELVKEKVLDSLKTYFAIGVVATLLLAVALAAFMSRSIARAYSVAFHELIAQRERVAYLEEMASWQALARMLAHEIRNPLTPIEMLVTSLRRAHESMPAHEFTVQLARTETMVGEELQHLRNLVTRFSEFATLPRIQPTEVNLATLLPQHLESLAAAFEMRYRVEGPADVRAHIDAPMFRQVLINIIRNGVEANPGAAVTFDAALATRGDVVELSIGNDGVPVPPEISARMFEPYVSGRTSKDNMGLGLAIVRKILVEHGGEIRYEERSSRPLFLITLPRLPT